MPDMTNTARFHRFHDAVAFSIGEDGSTVYLTPEFADKLADKLREFAADCRNTKFTDSTLTTTYVGEQPDTTENDDPPENNLARKRLNWMDRADIEKLLESIGIASYDDETTDELKDAVVQNINDGNLDIDDLPQTDNE